MCIPCVFGAKSAGQCICGERRYHVEGEEKKLLKLFSCLNYLCDYSHNRAEGSGVWCSLPQVEI